MKLSIRIFALACVLAILPQALVAANAPAATGLRYKWKDAQGGMHYSDTLPPEALQMGYDVVNAEGVLVKHVDRPRTAEERKKDSAALAAQEEAKLRDSRAAAADRQLLGTYVNDSDLAAVHKDRLDSIDQSMQAVQVSLADQEKGLSEQLAHAATFERDNKPVPAPVKQQIEALRKTIAEQNAFLIRREKERADMVKQSDAEMARYRELRAKAQAAAAAQQ